MIDFIEINGNKFTDLEKARDYFEKQVAIAEEIKENEFKNFLKEVARIKKKMYGTSTVVINDVDGVDFVIS